MHAATHHPPGRRPVRIFTARGRVAGSLLAGLAALLAVMAMASAALAADPVTAEPKDAALEDGTAHAAAPVDRAAKRTSSSRDVALSRKVRRVLARATGISSSDLQCWQNVSILAFGNGQYVSAELGYSGDNSGMLRARSGEPLEWERFTVCRDPSTGATLMASEANRQLVSAELGWGDPAYGMLRARALTAGPWEWFHTDSPPNSGQPKAPGGGRNWTAIKSAANDRYVSAELGYGGDWYGMLRARANAVNTWEWFFW